jgi:hypothetical protein
MDPTDPDPTPDPDPQHQPPPLPPLASKECSVIDGYKRKMIRLIKNNAKCRYLKKFTCKGTLRQVFICLRPPPLIGFCLGW